MSRKIIFQALNWKIKDVKENPYTHEVYEINAYYDAITGYRINLDYETIYIDDEGNRWYTLSEDGKRQYVDQNVIEYSNIIKINDRFFVSTR